MVVIDSDLQDPPGIVPQMIAKWEEGFRVVYGVPPAKGEGLVKRGAASLFYRLLQALSDTRLPLDAGDFASSTAPSLRSSRGCGGAPLHAGDDRLGRLPTVRPVLRPRPPLHGQTKYTVAKMLRLGLNAILSFSARPLYLAGYLGLGVTLLSLFLAAKVLLSKLFYPKDSVQGWPTLMIVVLFSAGIQLITMGVFGAVRWAAVRAIEAAAAVHRRADARISAKPRGARSRRCGCGSPPRGRKARVSRFAGSAISGACSAACVGTSSQKINVLRNWGGRGRRRKRRRRQGDRQRPRQTNRR